MIFLILNVICASAFMLTIKWVQVRKSEDVITVGALNYIVAVIALAPEFFSLEPSNVTSGAIMTGGVMGACYFICYFFVIYSIKYIGASSSTVVAVLSIVLPITCGVFVWGEQPNSLQVIGIILALLSLMLIGGNSKKSAKELAAFEEVGSDSWIEDGRPQMLESRQMNSETVPPSDLAPPESVDMKEPARWIMPVVLLIFFLLAGGSRLSQAAFKHVTGEESRPTFLFSAFVVAAIPSVFLLMFRRRKIGVMELFFGTLMGLANALQTHFILKSLHYFEGFVVFPVTSAGGLILTTLVATQMLGEKLNFRTYLGITIACVALVLLHWLPSSG